jgi:hypothetical protein
VQLLRVGVTLLEEPSHGLELGAQQQLGEPWQLAATTRGGRTRPQGDRWQPIFGRWLDGLAAKVSGLGGNPGEVPPSLTDPAGAYQPPGKDSGSDTNDPY